MSSESRRNSDLENPQWAEVSSRLTGRDIEDVTNPHSTEDDPEDYSDVIDRRRRERHREEQNKLERTEWGLMRTSEELSRILEERDEFWLLQYQSGRGFVPLVKADEDEYIIDERAHYSESSLEFETEDGKIEWNAPSTAEKSTKSGVLIEPDEKRDKVESVPIIENYVDSLPEYLIDGMYVAPGFEDFYREKAEEGI